MGKALVKHRSVALFGVTLGAVMAELAGFLVALNAILDRES